jgi:hypothetical protein
MGYDLTLQKIEGKNGSNIIYSDDKQPTPNSKLQVITNEHPRTICPADHSSCIPLTTLMTQMMKMTFLHCGHLIYMTTWS